LENAKDEGKAPFNMKALASNVDSNRDGEEGKCRPDIDKYQEATGDS
jgi:hypothetical protein